MTSEEKGKRKKEKIIIFLLFAFASSAARRRGERTVLVLLGEEVNERLAHFGARPVGAVERVGGHAHFAARGRCAEKNGCCCLRFHYSLSEAPLNRFF
jgi:hypothetical protein